MLLWKPSFSLMRMLVSLKTTDKNEQIDAGKYSILSVALP